MSATLNSGLLAISLSAAGDSATVSLSNGNIDIFDGANHLDFSAAAVSAISAQGASVPNQTVTFDSNVTLTGALSTSQITNLDFNGAYVVGSANLAATTIGFASGSALSAGTTGNLSLTATDSETGSSATAAASVTLTNASLTGAAITISASGSASFSGQGGILERDALASTATVSISGGSGIHASGALSISAGSSAAATAQAASSSTGGSTTVDGAVADSSVTSAALALVMDSTIAAGGAFSLSASNSTTGAVGADGTAGGASAAGGSVAVNRIRDVTTASLAGSTSVQAASVTVAAVSADAATTATKATAAGATQNDPTTQTDLSTYNAKTSDGPIQVAVRLRSRTWQGKLRRRSQQRARSLQRAP